MKRMTFIIMSLTAGLAFSSLGGLTPISSARASASSNTDSGLILPMPEGTSGQDVLEDNEPTIQLARRGRGRHHFEYRHHEYGNSCHRHRHRHQNYWHRHRYHCHGYRMMHS
jgi:hypothetical protein